jgi:hypothetical protein
MGNRSSVSSRLFFAFLSFALTTLIPKLCHADFDSSLVGIQIKLTNFVLPTLSVIGMGIAAVSFFTGSPNAKQHMVYAILGCVFGFGAQSIVNLIGGIVR